jgi:hypothetical protein
LLITLQNSNKPLFKSQLIAVFKPEWLHQWEVPGQEIQFILPDGKPCRVKLDRSYGEMNANISMTVLLLANNL